jgi:branched-subunit amino acid ABC-type transport system permease component
VLNAQMATYGGDVWANQIATGITRGGWIFLVAAGLTLVFGVLHILNFAHGSLFMLGAYIAAEVGDQFGNSLLGFVGVLLVAPLLVGLLGGAVELALLRRIYKRELLYQFLLMFGIVYVVAGVVKQVWGVGNYQMSAPKVLTSPVDILGVTLSRYNLFIFVAGLVAFLFLVLTLQRTAFGRDVRAVAQDPEMAALLGVRVSRVRTIVFAIGAWLAGVAGVVTAGFTSFGPEVGTNTIILAFVVVIVGGMGSILGAGVASILIGVAESIGALVIPDVSLTIVYVVMAAVLLVRPWGLFGQKGHA